MKTKLLMKLVLCLIMTYLINISAQEGEHLDGLIQVKFKKEAFSKLHSKLDLNVLKNAKLKNFLRDIGLQKSRKIFYNSVENDTIGISLNGEKFKRKDLSRWYLLSFNKKNDLKSVLKNIKKFKDIEYICPVTKWNIVSEPDDPYFVNGHQTGLNNGSTGRDIHAVQGWNYNKGRSDVKIAVIDAGVDYNHEDLDLGNRNRVINGYDAADNDYDPMDDLPNQCRAASHGTLVAGVVGALTNNDKGVAGIMHNLKIIPIKVFATNGQWWDPFSWSAGLAIDPWIADGIDYAVSHGAKVINLSLGGYGLSGWGNLFIGNPVGEAIYNAYHQGVLIVAAAGNDDTDELHFPSAFPGVMGIAAVNNNDVKTSFSNYGNYIDVCAPGDYYQNYSTKRNNDYDYFSGTSCSAPMVSGAAGLIISEALDRGIELTNDDIEHLLEATADKPIGMQNQNWHKNYGYGRINIERALKLLNSPYTVTTKTIFNSNGQLVRDSHKHQFFNNSGLASGNYMNVKQYKVTGHVTFPISYKSPPYVWIRERECNGWNYANPNLELNWIKITNITKVGFDYETVIYWIGTNSLGQQINKYWPGNSSSLKAKITYTAIGIQNPPISITPQVKNAGTGRAGKYIYGSFTVKNNSNVQYNLKIKSNLWDIEFVGENSIHYLQQTLYPGWSSTINYKSSFGRYEYGPFTATVRIDENNHNIHESHTLIGERLLPDFCFGETKALSASPEEQLFDGAFIGYFGFENDSITFDKKRSIKERLDFAYKLLKKDKKEKVENICKKIIELYPESEMEVSFYAMGLLWEAAYSDEANNFTEIDFKEYLKELTKKKNKYKINGYAQLILSLLDAGKDLKGLERLFSDYKYNDLRELALFHQFIHYSIYKKDMIKAKELSNRIDNLFKESVYGYEAHIMLGDKGYTLDGLKDLASKIQNNMLAKSNVIKADILSELPTEYELSQNYPNPFNPSTTIKYSIPKVSNAKLSIYNMMGQLIKVVVDNETKAPGFYSIEWNGTNEENKKVSSGIYFYRLESGNFVKSHKMMLIK